MRKFQHDPIPSFSDQVAVRLDSTDRPGSTSHPWEGRQSDSEDSEPPKTINIDESAPTSYVCLGYIFSIIAGLCFTSWQEELLIEWCLILEQFSFQQHWHQVCWSSHSGEFLADALCSLPRTKSHDATSGLVDKVSNPSSSSDPAPPPGLPSSPRQTSPPGGGSQPRPWWVASCCSLYSRLLRGCQ